MEIYTLFGKPEVKKLPYKQVVDCHINEQNDDLFFNGADNVVLDLMQ